MNTYTTHIAKLPKSPLQEVIFELHWDMDYQTNGVKVDAGFDLAQGVFSNLIELKFPIRKRNLPEQIQIAGVPVHQFWKGENVWPVVQLGQGILAINDTEKNYNWEETFYPLIKDSIKILIEAYKGKISFRRISLRYIDAIELGEEDLLKFVNSNFEINIGSNFEAPGELSDIAFSHGYKLKDESSLNLLINSGISDKGTRSLLWQSSVHLENSFTEEEVLTWTNEKHKVVSSLFKNTITKDFYEKFL